MTEPILDFHTHAQNVYGCCRVPRALRRFARTGLARLYERTGFDPRLKKAESELSMRLVAAEMQSRFASVDAGSYLDRMRRNGVTHACVLPVEPMGRTSDVLEMFRDQPEVIPFASVDFDRPDLVERLRGHLDAGCRGIKLHPIMQAVAPEDERIAAVFESIAGREVPVLFHTGRLRYFMDRPEGDPSFADPARLAPLARRFPHQPIVLGHMGLMDARPAIDLAAELPNVHLELSFQPARTIAEALRRVGPDRILLGSDWPASEASTEIALVRRAVAGDRRSERKILFENGARLLRAAGAKI